jgi:hypothetical protein
LLNDYWFIKGIREEIKKFLQSDKNEKTIYQNLWDAAQAGLKGRFIVMNAYIKNQRDSK